MGSVLSLAGTQATFPNRVEPRSEDRAWSLEDLAYHYGTDKSHDDHNYVDLYDMLFEPRRKLIRNMTEVLPSPGSNCPYWSCYELKRPRRD